MSNQLPDCSYPGAKEALLHFHVSDHPCPRTLHEFPIGSTLHNRTIADVKGCLPLGINGNVLSIPNHGLLENSFFITTHVASHDPDALYVDHDHQTSIRQSIAGIVVIVPHNSITWAPPTTTLFLADNHPNSFILSGEASEQIHFAGSGVSVSKFALSGLEAAVLQFTPLPLLTPKSSTAYRKIVDPKELIPTQTVIDLPSKRNRSTILFAGKSDSDTYHIKSLPEQDLSNTKLRSWAISASDPALSKRMYSLTQYSVHPEETESWSDSRLWWHDNFPNFIFYWHRYSDLADLPAPIRSAPLLGISNV